MRSRSELLAQTFEQLGHRVQIQLAAPFILRRQPLFSWFVIHLTAADSISTLKTGHTALSANRFVAHIQISRYSGYCFIDIAAVRVAVDHYGFPRGST